MSILLASLYHGLMVGGCGLLPLLYPSIFLSGFLGTASRIRFTAGGRRSHFLLRFPRVVWRVHLCVTTISLFGAWWARLVKHSGTSGAGVQSVGCLLVSMSGLPVGSSSYWTGGRLVFDQLVTLCLFSRSRSCCGIGVLVLVGCPLALLTFGFSGSGFGGAAFLYAKI